jgi:hypothetical protein
MFKICFNLKFFCLPFSCYTCTHTAENSFFNGTKISLGLSIDPCGFISVEMTKIVVGSSSLTQPLILYPGLGPAMLDNIGGVSNP